MACADAETTLKYALGYRRLGWSIIPVSKDKKPLLQSWVQYHNKRASEEDIRSWWSHWPDAGVGIVTGKISGITVIDVDSQEGMDALKEIIPPTLSVKTQRGGHHFYFKYTQDLSNRVGVIPGVDIRNDGGMVVAPPTSGRKGTYVWEDITAKILDIPKELKNRISTDKTRHLESKDWTEEIEAGRRDSELTRRAGRFIQIGIPDSEVLTILQSINQKHCKPPLDDKQLVKIVTSISNRENGKKETQGGSTKTEMKEFLVTNQREMLEKHSEDEGKWVVKDWLPEAGCGLVVAPPGNFKTWLLMALAYAVGTGRDFLGKYPVNNKGPVLVIQQEDPFWMLENRLSRMFNQLEPKSSENGTHELDCRFVNEFINSPIFWHERREFNLEDKSCLKAFETKISELKPRLVLLDPLYSAISAKDYMALGAQSMLTLKRLRDTYGTSFVIAHHTTVAGSGSEDRSSIWGSQFLNAWLEFGWRMPKSDDKGNVIIRHFKSAAVAPKLRMRFNITDWSFAVEIDETTGNTAHDSIEEALLSGKKFSTERALADACNYSPSRIHNAIKKMGIIKDKDGYYRIS